MKTQKTLKALVLSLAMVVGLLLPTTMLSQTDGFFRGDENYSNRDGIGLGGSSTENPGLGGMGLGGSTPEDPGQGGMGLGGMTQENPLPLGSGLLILTAVGGAYALARRKH